MKKFLVVIFLTLFFLGFDKVSANTLHSLDTTVKIDQNGNGHVTEIWDVSIDKGTEIYHSFGNMNDYVISDFNVSMNGVLYENIYNWNVHASKGEKAYKNGINYTDGGFELCFGIEYGRHVYTVNYSIENLVMDYEDSQILYFTFLPQNMPTPPQKFKLTINTDVLLNEIKYSSYGFVSNNHITNGNIIFESTGPMFSDQYVTALVGFPLGSFDIVKKKSGSFDTVAKEALEGAIPNQNSKEVFVVFLMTIIGIFLTVVIVVFFSNQKYKSRYENDFDLPKMKEANNFRDVPFEKNFLLAYFIGIEKRLFVKNNLLGAILLKWLRNKKIDMVPTDGDGIFDFNKNDNYYLDVTNLTDLKDLDNEIEQNMARYLLKASDNMKLTPKSFSKWSRKNYEKIFDLLKDAGEYSKDELVNRGYIIKKTEAYGKRNKTKSKYAFTDKLKEETIRLQGLKKFLNDMTLIDEKKAIEVHLWEEYLMFAQLFGNADKVAKQFKKFHELNYQENMTYYDNLFAIHIMSNSFMNAVSASSSAAAASSGGSFSGGGMSSGGFSGGGGGVR